MIRAALRKESPPHETDIEQGLMVDASDSFRLHLPHKDIKSKKAFKSEPYYVLECDSPDDIDLLV